MRGFSSDTKHDAKCNVIHGAMGKVDASQLPTKRKPFATILDHHFINKVEVILPEELYNLIKDDCFLEPLKPVFSRVILSLRALLEGEFFDHYIKKGQWPIFETHGLESNILMLSEVRIGEDKFYSLREGVLTLYLDKESYERAGLVGKPDGVKGKRGKKPRWVVELNLRLPSMVHGKKGFDRIVYAFKNVLNTPVTWLFSDLGTAAPNPQPIDTHLPTKIAVSPEIYHRVEVGIPPLDLPKSTCAEHKEAFEEFATEIHEWLSLVSLDSPRLNFNDEIDSFLCRYTTPGDSNVTSRLVKVTWRGFFSSSWAHKTFVGILLATPRSMWFAYSIVGFREGWSSDSRDCTILKPPNAPNEYILWDIA